MKIIFPMPMSWGAMLDIEGELLPDIAPHLASMATFVVHRSLYSGNWQISNIESGCRIGEFHKSKTAAISSARKYLSGKTIIGLLRAYKKAEVE